jgi:hypothetical protein
MALLGFLLTLLSFNIRLLILLLQAAAEVGVRMLVAEVAQAAT